MYDMDELYSYIRNTWISIQYSWHDREANIFEENYINKYLMSVSSFNEKCNELEAKMRETIYFLQEL